MGRELMEYLTLTQNQVGAPHGTVVTDWTGQTRPMTADANDLKKLFANGCDFKLIL